MMLLRLFRSRWSVLLLLLGTMLTCAPAEWKHAGAGAPAAKTTPPPAPLAPEGGEPTLPFAPTPAENLSKKEEESLLQLVKLLTTAGGKLGPVRDAYEEMKKQEEAFTAVKRHKASRFVKRTFFASLQSPEQKEEVYSQLLKDKNTKIPLIHFLIDAMFDDPVAIEKDFLKRLEQGVLNDTVDYTKHCTCHEGNRSFIAVYVRILKEYVEPNMTSNTEINSVTGEPRKKNKSTVADWFATCRKLMERVCNQKVYAASKLDAAGRQELGQQVAFAYYGPDVFANITGPEVNEEHNKTIIASDHTRRTLPIAAMIVSNFDLKDYIAVLKDREAGLQLNWFVEENQAGRGLGVIARIFDLALSQVVHVNKSPLPATAKEDAETAEKNIDYIRDALPLGCFFEEKQFEVIFNEHIPYKLVKKLLLERYGRLGFGVQFEANLGKIGKYLGVPFDRADNSAAWRNALKNKKLKNPALSSDANLDDLAVGLKRKYDAGTTSGAWDAW